MQAEEIASEITSDKQAVSQKATAKKIVYDKDAADIAVAYKGIADKIIVQAANKPKVKPAHALIHQATPPPVATYSGLG